MSKYNKENNNMICNIASSDFVDDPVGDTASNERSVTVALGKNFINHFDNKVVEINSIMPFYGYSTHSICSSKEVSPPAGVVHSLESFDFNDKCVFCLDTSSEPIDVQNLYTSTNSLLLTYTKKQDDFLGFCNSEYNKFFYYRENQSKWIYTEDFSDIEDKEEVLLFIHKNL